MHRNRYHVMPHPEQPEGWAVWDDEAIDGLGGFVANCQTLEHACTIVDALNARVAA